MKILVVNNNPMMLRLLVGFLADELAHEVLTAPDGLFALHLLGEFTPDVVITDLVLPDIADAMLCRTIRDLPRLNSCFMIILSTITAGKDPAACGADVCITTDQTGELKKRLRETLQQAGQRQSDKSYEVDLTLGGDQVHDRELTRELLNSRAYFAEIVARLDEGIFGLSRDGQIIYVNPAAVQLAGLAEKKLLGCEFVALFTEPDRAVVRRGLQEIGRSGDDAPLRIDSDPPLHLNGYYVFLKCLPVQVEGQRAIVVLMQDQTDKILRLTI